MRRAASFIGALVLATFLLGACGEKSCNQAGSGKAAGSHHYYCADRNDGNGLRWYPDHLNDRWY